MRHLIIAEDDPELTNVYRSFAERAGWNVQTCNSGAGIKALLAQGDEPVLLLIDINMPEKDGIEAIDDILSVPRPMRLRFMTGGDDAPIVAAKMIAAARDLSVGKNVYKPIPKERFLDILENEAEFLDQIATRDD
ncbi:response regulator [Loktanella agnita]|uniref:response regulator n=1 Tax=Loktanella agnita TaxID=287097 RepID=UPI0039890C09